MAEKKKTPAEEREEREAAIRDEMRKEAHARATDASPFQVGTDLIEENPERAEARKQKKG